MGKFFGTDGVRGVANRDLTADLALRLGSAAARVLLTRPHGVKVLIGRDPRISGDMLESALAAGFASRGADIILVGAIPTPGVACLVKEADVDVGCVISASHNPVDYNGIKFFGHDGEKLADETESEIESHLDDPISQDLPIGENIGRFWRQPQRVERYAYAVKQTCRARLTGMKLVIDGANGAAYDLAPRLFRELGAEVVTIGCDPDGNNINAGVGSTHPERMLEMIAREGADAGLAFDGDADRVLMGSEKGELVDGDKIMAICGISMARRGALPGNAVVATVMSNMGLEVALRENGLVLDRVDEVGDRYVAERMRKMGYRIGGEKSGHIILSDYTTTGDGMVTGLQVLSAMQESGQSLSELAAVMTEFPQVLDGVRVKDKTGWDEKPVIQNAIREAQQILEGRGRLHVRPSGTEPLIRVMAEGPDEQELRQIINEVCCAIRENVGAAE